MAFKQSDFAHIRAIQIKATRNVNDLFGGMYRSAFKGRGLEFEEVREYLPGDEIRSIDWHVTARMQNAYVKNYKEERELTLMLVIDISAATHFGHAAYLKSEMIAEIGALLAFSAIKNHDKVGLLLYTSEVELFLKPKKGLKHVLRCIRELLYFQAKYPGKNLKTALNFLGKVQKQKAVCFVISDFMGDHSEHELSITAQRHETIAIQIYDTYERELPLLGLLKLYDLESQSYTYVDTSHPVIREHYQKKSAEQQQLVKKMMNKFGIDFISMHTQEDYLKILRHFFLKRGHSH